MPEKKDFTIKDRRIFSEEAQDVEEKEEQEKPSSEEPKEPAPEETAGPEEDQEDFPLPEINFSTFIFSLNTSVLVHLGAIEDPSTGKKAKNLSFAKQTIDILGMLEEKTQGNLTNDEEAMLKNILYDLRIIYVKEKG
jgi:hypothetical protein